MKKRMIKNLMLVVVMVVLCVAVGMTASAGNYEDIWTQGFANEDQVVIVFDLEGGKINGTVENFNLETMSFETVTELSGKYVMVPKNETEQAEGSHILFPSIIAPDEYHEMIGWHLVEHNTVYAPGCLFFIPEPTAGTIIKFTALYEDNTPYNLVNGELTAGENLSWFFDKTTGTLEISGEGEMWNFDSKNYLCPWKEYKDDICAVTIGNGVTTIGDNAFAECYNLVEASLPDSITTIGEQSFCYCVRLSEINVPSSVNTIETAAFQLCFSLADVVIPENVETIGELAFSMVVYPQIITVKNMNVNIGYFPFCATPFETPNISLEEFVDIYIGYVYEGDESFQDEYNKYVVYTDNVLFIGTIYCHAGSTAEKYAIENGVDYELTHFFEGEWTYDYDNMIRYRKCIHCDELETEALETTESGDVEIIEPTNPDTDFTVDVIEDYVVIEETISNNITTDFEIVKAFDINLKNKDGVHVQPDGTVKVKLPLDWSKDGVYKVYRVNDDGTLTDMNAYREGSHMVFDTDHFSIYVIVDESEKTDEPITPDEPQEETKDSFFSKIIDLIKSFFELIMSWFKK